MYLSCIIPTGYLTVGCIVGKLRHFHHQLPQLHMPVYSVVCRKIHSLTHSVMSLVAEADSTTVSAAGDEADSTMPLVAEVDSTMASVAEAASALDHLKGVEAAEDEADSTTVSAAGDEVDSTTMSLADEVDSAMPLVAEVDSTMASAGAAEVDGELLAFQ